MTSARRAARCVVLGCLLAFVGCAALADELATITGRITDPHSLVVAGVKIDATNINTNITYSGESNADGLYRIPGIPSGAYRVIVQKTGFAQIVKPGVDLHVQDVITLNFTMQVGSVSETITVEGGAPLANTESAAVSTVVDRKFVENIPLNGRSFQDLLTLSPGVVAVPAFLGSTGEISVNGQRTEANYFTVDGVTVNTGTLASNNSFNGAGISGNLPAETVQGTTQSIVSVDALQEFRATTSTYSAQYGRTPGGQFSFSTRSGTNDWHGSAFDYFRNDAMDANNWFNNAAVPRVSRLAERQNDFGGTLGGPLEIPGIYRGKDRTFFFFSYEGLRLTVPQPVVQDLVPDAALRTQVPAALQPFVNAFPVANGGEDGSNDGLAFFNLAYSAPSSLDSTSIRVDHTFGDKLRVFGRYADTSSSGWIYSEPAIKNTDTIDTRTVTVGATSTFTTTQANELRFNLTQNNMTNIYTSTNFGGAAPLDLTSIPGPNGQSATTVGTAVALFLCFVQCPSFWQVSENTAAMRQYNFIDTYTWSRAAHRLQFGVDWRRLTTFVRPITNSEFAFFTDETSLQSNSALFISVNPLPTSFPVKPVYHNFSAFFQDEWKTTHRLSLSLGLRWDINPAPGNLIGPSPYTVDQIANLATTQLAPTNTPLWKTDWHGFAPRAGLAYQLRQAPGSETVLRTGFGLFYDTGNATGSDGFNNAVGFTSNATFFGASFPLSSAQVTLPPPSIASPYGANVRAFDPNLKLPYTMQWNLAIEQGLGTRQTLTVNYVGSGGRKLLATFEYVPFALGNPNFRPGGALFVTSNRASSGYNAFQLKYQKKVSHGLQALASYTWSHSIDNASNNETLGELLRSSSDFDVRHNLQAALTYDIPGAHGNPVLSRLFTRWGLDTRISVRSALPVDIIGRQAANPTTQQFEFFHPDLVPGNPVYLYGSQYPGSRIINYNAFTPAPAGVDGDTGRNSARAFGAVEADLALRRDFPISERLRVQIRAEAFNVFNHPNFGSIYNHLSDGPTRFGFASNTLNSSLGGLNSLYQVGGPRSMQLMLKLQF